MRRAAGFGRWSGFVRFVFLLPSSTWGQEAQYIGVPGPGPVAPAPDVPESPLSPEDQLESPPDIHPEEFYQTERDITTGIGEALSNAQLDPGIPDNTFILKASFNGIDGTYLGSPDLTIAAGPTHLLLGTNGLVKILDKKGAIIGSATPRTMFGSVLFSGEHIEELRAVFDPGSNRFFLGAWGFIYNPDCTPGTCVAHLFLAVSKTSTPTTLGQSDWWFYAFDATLNGTTPTANWADWTSLGIDETTVVLTANMISFGAGGPHQSSFQYVKIRVLDKSKLIKGEPVTWTDFFGSSG